MIQYFWVRGNLSLDIFLLLWYMLVLRGGEKQDIILGAWAVEWFHVHAEGKLAHNIEGGYQSLTSNHMAPRLGGVVLTDLSEKRIRAFYLPKVGLSAYPILYAGLPSGLLGN